MIRALSALTALPRSQWVARTAIAVLPVAALLCVGAAGAGTPAWVVVVVALFSLCWAALPESPVGAVALAVVVVWWGVQLGSEVDPLVLPAAAALAAAHVAAVVASYGPAAMPLDPAVVRLWARRAATVYLPVPVVYLVAAWSQKQSMPSGWWLAGLAATFLAIAVTSVTLSVQNEEEAAVGTA